MALTWFLDLLSLQENCNDNHIAVHPDVDRTVETAALLSPAPPYGSFMSNIDLQPPLLDQPLSKDEPSGANQIASACILSSAVPTFQMRDAEQLHQQNQIMNSETGLHTPRTVVQPLQITQGSISSLRSKRQQLFTPISYSASNVVGQEACSLGSELMRHGKRISALDDVLKFKLHESPAAHNLQLPMVERNELVRNSHMDLDGSGRKRSTEENGCVEHQLHEKRAKGPRSPITSRNQLPCVSLSSRMAEENQSGAHDSGQSLSDDSNKARLRIASLKCMAEENQSGADDSGQSLSDDWNKVR